ncbi:unnamed protein product [Schistosoma rodhaini]|uniref:Uncharacterized protein n=1 Tax=Schistosoma rodhaini TaxID=6188 RepID=A0AA85FZU5_9TREM|nr:unnamed protein product [Schistosoma rodhaini]
MSNKSAANEQTDELSKLGKVQPFVSHRGFIITSILSTRIPVLTGNSTGTSSWKSYATQGHSCRWFNSTVTHSQRDHLVMSLSNGSLLRSAQLVFFRQPFRCAGVKKKKNYAETPSRYRPSVLVKTLRGFQFNDGDYVYKGDILVRQATDQSNVGCYHWTRFLKCSETMRVI